VTRRSCCEHSVHASVEADMAVIDIVDAVISRLERAIIKVARGHDGHAIALLKSVYGIGDIIGLLGIGSHRLLKD